jgi:hypothetical protein
MNRDLAKHVAVTGFRSMSHVTNLLPLLKAHCDPDEYAAYKDAIANIAAALSVEIITRVFSSHPEVEKDIDGKVAAYGKIL